MSERKDKKELEATWSEKLKEAERALQMAQAYVAKVQAEYKSPPPSDGKDALRRAMKLLELASNQHTRVLDAFTRLTVYGKEPKESDEPRHPVYNRDIQAWVFKHHRFIPPSCIAYCMEVYLKMPPIRRSTLEDCPPEKQAAIRESFVALEDCCRIRCLPCREGSLAMCDSEHFVTRLGKPSQPAWYY